MNTAGILFFQIVFDLYILVVLLRLTLQLVHADYYNTIAQFTVKVTDPLVSPLKRFIPRYKRVDLAVVVVLIVLEMIKLVTVVWLKTGLLGNPLGIFFLALGGLLNQLTNLFFYAIFVRIILSWLAPQKVNPVVELLHQLTEPLLAPARRFIRPIGGFDLSPIAVIIGLKLIAMIVFYPLAHIGVIIMVNAL